MKLVNCYPQIVSDENIWLAWIRFRSGKGRRADVRLFERSLEANLLELRHSLRDHSYQHGSYRSFVVHDPKRRLIHVPIVCDQVVHQMIWNILFPFSNGSYSLHRFRSTFDSLRGLAIEDKRWTKCVQAAILEAV